MLRAAGIRRVAWVFSAALLALVLPACRSETTGTAGRSEKRPVTVAASIFPIADLARQIASDRAEVVWLLPAGASPHGFHVRPAEAMVLRRAKVLFVVGGLDDWAVRAARAMNPSLKVVSLMEALGRGEQDHSPAASSSAASNDETDSREHHHAGGDPHIWLDPVAAQRIAEVIAAALCEVDPQGRQVYEARLERLRSRLKALDAEYREALSNCACRTLVVFHPAFGHLARRYGLEQVAILGPGGARPGWIERVIRRIRQQRIRAVFKHPQFSSPWEQVIVSRTGVRVLVLDPLGNPHRKGYDGYLQLMRSNLAVLKEGLGCGRTAADRDG